MIFQLSDVVSRENFLQLRYEIGNWKKYGYLRIVKYPEKNRKLLGRNVVEDHRVGVRRALLQWARTSGTFEITSKYRGFAD
jgi:hypothetical protein